MGDDGKMYKYFYFNHIKIKIFVEIGKFVFNILQPKYQVFFFVLDLDIKKDVVIMGESLDLQAVYYPPENPKYIHLLGM